MVVLGLDFGGSKLAAGTVEVQSEHLLNSAQIPTQGDVGAEAVFTDMVALARSLRGREAIQRVGVCFGGHVRQNRVLRSLHVSGWEDFPLVERLQEIFDVDTIRVENDANAIALGEWKYGAGRGAESLLYVTVSTGVGGGIVAQGRLYAGATGMAGEIGHMKLLSDGPPCPCGGQGCVEALAAGPAIARRATALLAQHPEISSAMRECSAVTARQVNELAHQGDVLAAQALREGARYLGLAIANAINLLDVEQVVVGGGVSRAGPIWWDALRAAVHEGILPGRDSVSIKSSGLGEDAGIWGAVAVVRRAESGAARGAGSGERKDEVGRMKDENGRDDG